LAYPKISSKPVKLEISDSVYSSIWAVSTKLANTFPEKGHGLGHVSLGGHNPQLAAMLRRLWCNILCSDVNVLYNCLLVLVAASVIGPVC